MVAPPVQAGAVNSTVAVVDPVAVAVEIVGAPGAIAEIVAVVFEFAFTLLIAFVAVTLAYNVFPTSPETNV
jgi:hypothetical protein